MKNKLTIKQRIKACFILLVSGSLPSWWWSDLSDKFYESKVVHDYKDGKYVYEGYEYEIQSFHQLQNLFYAITGEELEIKL